MIRLTTGNILESTADAIVNTVNCEGYMGKGIAYQFKLEFPLNFDSYAQTCKQKLLKPGKLHIFQENGKIIINFPTKDKWRAKSKYEYIEDGLKTLKTALKEWGISSISIPPLGCGNGGLEWGKVKDIIFAELADESDVDIILYEPSKSYKSQPKVEPSLSLSHYLAMEVKNHVNKFSRFRLQKALFLVDFLNNDNYFKFDAHKFGPYSHSLDIVSKQISEYQEYHKSDTKNAQELLEKKLQSENFYRSKDSQASAINKATTLVNSIETDWELELITSILYVIHKNQVTTAQEISSTISNWTERKNKIFKEADIDKKIHELIERKLIAIDFLNNITKA
ncbi:type II toxin-antitoxin system antitoxin DNA ADP-ribosyl glycohydrolase DarG [Pseudomonas frederiksbergensis]|uniref:type II toxin-antitoxin system antitoxin DNA ADP-ribosyl glycohydrolase DarG n=1 Tax=Pseudomonas frederiksbergensis TaxID=104087 RepID=UPI003D233E95